MNAVLRLEIIGWNTLRTLQGFSKIEGPYLRRGRGRRNDSNAEIASLFPSVQWLNAAGQATYVRRDHLDFSDANSVGSRGVFGVWILESGMTYAVRERTAWKSFRTYRCRVNPDTGAIERVEAGDAEAPARG